MGLADCLQAIVGQGARRVLIPVLNASEISSLPQEILRKIEIGFYTDARDAVVKALGL